MKKTESANWIQATRENAYKTMSGLSAVAIVLWFVDSSSLVSHLVQAAIWMVFFVYTVGYVHIAHPGKSWWRHHVADMVIVVTWNPLFLSESFWTERLAPATLHFIGLLAHGLVSSRFVRSRWGKHPLIASVVGLICVIGLGAVLLHRLEPTTFKSFWEGAWFAFETVTTLGFGEVVPHTEAGQVVTAAVCLLGSGLLSVLSTFLAVNILERVHWDPTRRSNRSAAEISTKELLSEIKGLTAQVQLLTEKVDKLTAGAPTPTNSPNP